MWMVEAPQSAVFCYGSPHKLIWSLCTCSKVEAIVTPSLTSYSANSTSLV